MARALRLAERGIYTAHPNPMVGCVLVRDGKIVGEGWHEFAGDAHAEINALRVAGDKARGATAYLTLEPCSHEGKTPPCAPALIEAGIREAVIAMEDPFPAVSGNGQAALQAAGIGVRSGLMQETAEALNAGFLSRVRRGRPFVRLKVASSLDGGIAMKSGESQWITGPEARDDVQRLRARSGAILTGIGWRPGCWQCPETRSFTARTMRGGSRWWIPAPAWYACTVPPAFSTCSRCLPISRTGKSTTYWSRPGPAYPGTCCRAGWSTNL